MVSTWEQRGHSIWIGGTTFPNKKGGAVKDDFRASNQTHVLRREQSNVQKFVDYQNIFFAESSGSFPLLRTKDLNLLRVLSRVLTKQESRCNVSKTRVLEFRPITANTHKNVHHAHAFAFTRTIVTQNTTRAHP